MKKSVINRILIGVIAFLLVAICILSVEIAKRPRYINIAEPETNMIEEASLEAVQAGESPESEQTTESGETAALRGKTSTRVNIRDAASDQAKVLATVDEGYEFDIIEIQDNGWIKIKYEEQDAYISSSYVILVQS